MVADYLTKPLCGEKFKHFRGKMMNCDVVRLTSLAKQDESRSESNLAQLAGMSAQKQMNLAKCKAISKLQKDLVKVKASGKRVHEWQSEDKCCVILHL